MKLQLTAIVLTAGLSVLLGSSTLSAQDRKATADIPFAYHVGQQTFSPGKYTVVKGSLPSVFTLREKGAGHDSFIPVLLHNTGDKEAWNLTFSCYGDDCTLSQIRMANDSYNINAKPPIRVGKVAAMISVPLR